MKKIKILLVLCTLFILGGCTMTYEEVKPIAEINGTVVTIDSTKWRPVLMQESSEYILIAEKGEIRKIHLLSDSNYGIIAILLILIVFIIIIAAGRD